MENNIISLSTSNHLLIDCIFNGWDPPPIAYQNCSFHLQVESESKRNSETKESILLQTVAILVSVQVVILGRTQELAKSIDRKVKQTEQILQCT